MPAKKVIKKLENPSFARLSPLAKGRVIGLREAGHDRADIADRVRKKDSTSPCLQTVDGILARFKEDPAWDGVEERTAGGRPRSARRSALLRLDIKVTSRSHPGHNQVTSRSCK